MEDYDNGARISRVPKVNGEIDYDSINPTIWYYDIRMVNTSLVHTTTFYSDTIYEEGFATDWNAAGQP